MNKKKCQVWAMDLTIAVIIFLMGIMLFLVYSINYSTETNEAFEYLYYDGMVLIDSILSEGFPNDWNSSNALRIGVITNNQINETKLERFYNLTVSDYNRTKIIFDTKFDYYFFLDENMTVNSGSIEGIGKPNHDISKAQNLIKITRATIYKNKPVGAYLYIWEE